MASLDSICGITSVHLGCDITLVCEGLSPGATASFLFNGVAAGSDVAGADGVSILTVSNLLAASGDWTVKVGGVTVAGPYFTEWVGAGACPVIFTGAALDVVAFDDKAALNWLAAVACDVRFGSPAYTVLRGTSSPPGTTIVSGLSTLAYTDSGLTVGTTYFYRIKADWSNVSFVGTVNSNIVQVSAGGFWGAIVQ